MDGLLVDSEPLWLRAEIGVFAAQGVLLTPEQVQTTKGRFVGEVVRHWYGLYPWKGASPEEVCDGITDAVDALLEHEVELKPGALHALGFCARRGLRLALASSSPRRLIETVIRRHGLGPWFEVVHSGEHEARGKPDPAIFLSSATQLGVAPTRCVVLEDSVAGVQAATAAGMASVAVPESGPGAEDGTVAEAFDEADLVLGSLTELSERSWSELEAAVAARPG